MLFDLDGVIVDSTPAIEASWQRWAYAHKLNFTELRHYIHGRKAVDVIAHFLPDSDVQAEWQVLIEQEMNNSADLRTYPGVVELLMVLANKPWAIVTSAPRNVALQRLQQFNLPVPQVLITAEDVSMGKPSPEGFLLAADTLRVNPTDCLVFEDSFSGIRAAKAGQMSVLGVATTHKLEEFTDEPDGVIAGLGAVDAATLKYQTEVLYFSASLLAAGRRFKGR